MPAAALVSQIEREKEKRRDKQRQRERETGRKNTAQTEDSHSRAEVPEAAPALSVRQSERGRKREKERERDRQAGKESVEGRTNMKTVDTFRRRVQEQDDDH